jgi:hypothetical protein
MAKQRLELALLALILFFGFPCVSLCQTPSTDNLRQIAQKTIHALSVDDSAYIVSILDPHGIYIGLDAPKMSASSFRTQMSAHRGVYCDLFEHGCKEKLSPGSSSLAHVLASGPAPELSVQLDQGSVRAIGKSSHEELFTLYYRFSNGQWLLTQIDYV